MQIFLWQKIGISRRSAAKSTSVLSAASIIFQSLGIAFQQQEKPSLKFSIVFVLYFFLTYFFLLEYGVSSFFYEQGI